MVFVCVNENKTQENSSRLLGHSQRSTKWDELFLWKMRPKLEKPSSSLFRRSEALWEAKKKDFLAVDYSGVQVRKHRYLFLYNSSLFPMCFCAFCVKVGWSLSNS